jgi:hypothetical protein
MSVSWESEIAALLTELLRVQGEILELLGRKRALLVAADTAGLAAIAPEEQRLAEALQTCLQRRSELLERAGKEGLPDSSLQALADALPRKQREFLHPTLRQACSQAHLLRHEGLVNWVLIQRTLLYLSHLLEIIATGGQRKPTYGVGETVSGKGCLVDEAA